MAKNNTELVKSVNDIISNVQKYIQILQEGDDGKLIQRFNTFDYWYYFPTLDIFIPNKFLGYKKHATEPYNPSHGNGMNGAIAREALEKYFDHATKEEIHELRKKLDDFAGDYGKKIKIRTKRGEEVGIFKPKAQYLDFFTKDLKRASEKTDITQKAIQESNQVNNKLLKKESNPNLEQSHVITKRIGELINQINKNCKNRNKPSIFDDLFSLWSEFVEQCNSKNDFKNFALNLYIIIYEKTREKKLNHNKGIPYIYRLPYQFTKDNKKTREFFEIVGAIRHEYAHKEPEYDVRINKISYPDALKKLTGSLNQPSTKEEFQKLQLEVLKLFEESMSLLLEIVKKE